MANESTGNEFHDWLVLKMGIGQSTIMLWDSSLGRAVWERSLGRAIWDSSLARAPWVSWITQLQERYGIAHWVE